MGESRTGLVSVILVNYRGADDTLIAIKALGELDWPSDRLEIIVVDNDSRDGSVERIRAGAPQAVLVESGANLGFAGGCNLGVSRSHGEFVAFLNSDARPDPGWVREAIAAFGQSDDVGAVASRVLDWNGERVDFIDAGLAWFGKGYKPYVGERASGLGETAHDVLFGTGSAMFVRAAVYRELGGFDEDFFMFYEDVDFGWRLNLRGWRFRYQPESLAYHRHHAAAGKYGSFKEDYLLERNALFTLFKNVEESRLNEALPAALALTVRRGVVAGSLDSTEFDYRAGADDRQLTQEVSREALASLYAIDQFVENLPGLTEKRNSIQASRKVSDRQLFSLFGRVDVLAPLDDTHDEGYRSIVESFDVTGVPRSTRVLIITGDPIGAKMAGPAIRAWHMAEALAARNDVTLLTLSLLEKVDAPFALKSIRAGDSRAFVPWEAWADIIVFQGHAMAAFPALAETDKIVIADIYDPMHLEQLEQGRELPAGTWDRQVTDATRVLNQQLARADFLLCASERQRWFYLGQLAALGRINPANYVDDPDLTGLIALAPFGLDAQPPMHRSAVLKGVLPGIAVDDKVLLWGGGLYSWFDPDSLIRAVAALGETRPGVRLFFQGTRHPHPGVPEMEVVRTSRDLAAELGVLDRSVFFNDSWVDYADRENYLTEADAGVSTHFQHVETTFSFRTRILDYLWAGLPMVVTDGDSFAELVRDEGLGVVVPEGDVPALTAAIEAVLFDQELIAAAKANIGRVRERFFWERSLAPLVTFVDHPRHAADLRERRVAQGIQPLTRGWRTRKPYGLMHNLSLVRHHLANGGPRLVMRKIANRLRSR